MQIGVELEYWVVDDRGRLADATELLDAHEHVENEFVAPLVEIQVPPVRHDADLRRELVSVLDALLDEAAAADKHLVPLGTPLTGHDLPIITERGRLLERIYGDDLRYAKHCAGTHVHFDKGNVVGQLNLLTALDPALALVASSPYYEGRRLAGSSRALVYRLQSNAVFSRHRDLWEYVEDLGEWEARLRRQHDVLRTIAAERGVPNEEFDASVDPENAVLTPVRLRKHSPTVEWRAPDTALPSQTIQLVSDVYGLLKQTEYKAVLPGRPGVEAERIVVPPFAELRALSATAIDTGLDADRVRRYLRKMRFDLSQYDPLAPQIAGGDELAEGDARRIRLDCAAQLEADVERLRR